MFGFLIIKLNHYILIFLKVIKENERDMRSKENEKSMKKQHDCDDYCEDKEVVTTKNKKRNRL